MTCYLSAGDTAVADTTYHVMFGQDPLRTDICTFADYVIHGDRAIQES